MMKEQRRQAVAEQDARAHIVACKDKPFLIERFIDSDKGRGVFTCKAIKSSSFVIEYHGELISRGRKPEKSHRDMLKGFLYEFSWNGELWCVDASKEDLTLGRLVNDDHISPNCEMRKIVCEGKPHLCLFAVEDIFPGEEITYSYGDSSYPWRSEELCFGETSSNTESQPSSSTSNTESQPSSSTSNTESQPSSSTSNTESQPSSSTSNTESQPSSSTSNTESQPSSSTPRKKKKRMAADSHCDRSSSSDEEPAPIGVRSQNKLLDSSNETSRALIPPLEEKSCDESDSGKGGEPKHGKTSSMENPPFTIHNYCYVCGKGMIKAARHLKLHADNEPDIAKAFAFPAKSSQRRKLLDILRNRGNSQHNQQVLSSNTGVLKVRRRSRGDAADATCYSRCFYCKAMFKQSQLWRHVSSCAKKTSESITSGQMGALEDISPEESEFKHQIPSDVKKILSTMKQDEIPLVIRNDLLLIQLAKSLTRKFRKDPSKRDYIQRKLREMGRFLLELQKKAILSFEDALLPKNFFRVVTCMKKIVGFNDRDDSYVKPALALKLGNSLKRMGNLVLSQEKSSETMKTSARIFIEKCDREWRVSQKDVSSARGQKPSRPSTVPFTRDVQALYKYMESLSASATESLKTGEDSQVFNALSRVTLAQASVFSKSTLHVSEMSLKAFQERDGATQILSKNFIRINILSKGGQSVSVLLTSQLVGALTLLVSKRLACGVHENNPFLFAKPDSSESSHYHGSHCIKSFSSLCGAENPEHLWSDHLLKHIARVFQILNLENDELEHLSKLMGYDIRADQEYYRTPQAAAELAKIAKLLEAMEKGPLGKSKGKSLEEVEIEDQLEPDVEQSSRGKGTEKDSSPPQQSDDAEQSRRVAAEQDALEHIKARRDKSFLQERFIDSFKGRGVFTKEPIEPWTFVVEFRGNVCPAEEPSEENHGDALKDFLFYFSWNGTNWCIDASADDGTLGRLVNDDHINPNCKVMKMTHEEKPHLCLFAQKKILPGEEITFDYGGNSTRYVWRSKEVGEDVKMSETDSKAAGPSLVDEQDEDSAESFSYDESSGEEYVCAEKPDSDDSMSESELPEEGSSEQNDLTRFSSDGSDSEKAFRSPTCTNRNFCYVCDKPQGKISRHLFTHRNEEPEIAEAFSLPKHGKARQKLLQKLRSRGNYKHNQKVLKSRRGHLKVRKKTNLSSLEMSAACIYCKVLVRRNGFWKHLQTCSSKISNPPAESRAQILALVATGFTDPQHMSSDVKRMLKKLKKDEFGSLVLKDTYLLRLAHCLYHLSESKQRDSEISRKLRYLGRLLAILNEKSIFSFDEALKPQNFSSIVEAVAKLKGSSKDFSKRLVCAIPALLRKLANVKYAVVLNDRADKEVIEEAEEFMKLCAKEWPSNVPGPSKGPNPPTLPFIRDVQVLFKHIENILASAVKSLTLYECPPVYYALLKVIVAYALILNRNEDISHVTLQSFLERKDPELQETTDGRQIQFEDIFSKCTVKLHVATKVGQKVVLVLTPDLLSAITLLVEKRKTASVSEHNPYLLAKPNASSVCSPFHFLSTFIGFCGAKDPAFLRSPLFRKHMARVFQILILGNDELDLLAKHLGRDIQTEGEFYRTPEAAADIAKVLLLLSAVESGYPELFDGKSLEEIEIPDKLQPVVEQTRPAEDEDSSQADGASPSKRKSSAAKRKSRGRKRKKDEEDVNEQPEPNEEQQDAAEREKDKNSEKIPEEPPSQSKTTKSHTYFSDDDEGMNVDFSMDIDTDDYDDVRNEQSQADGDEENEERERKDHADEVVDTSEKSHLEEGGDEEEEAADSDGSPPPLRTAAKDKLAALLSRMKEVKILLPRLSLDKMETPINNLSIERPVNEHPAPVDDARREPPPPPPPPVEERNKPDPKKVVRMVCSTCEAVMMKGQTAYQMKGFAQVFCSKSCLLEKFPPSKATVKSCYYCFRDISQPLDLIMAVVDLKGTMKDFCSVSCLSFFKTNPSSMKTRHSLSSRFSTTSTQTFTSHCRTCKRTCSTPLEWTLDATIHKFCSSVCLETFCQDKLGACDYCSSACRRKPLRLKLEDDTKSICGQQCLQELKESMEVSQDCTMCGFPQLVSGMVDLKTNENVVLLFCSQSCIASYKLQPQNLERCQNTDPENTNSSLRQKQTGTDPEQESRSGDGRSDSNAAGNRPDAARSAETDDIARLIIQADDITCFSCFKRVMKGCKVYQLKRAKHLFCSASCVTELYPQVLFYIRKCFSCLQLITQPQKVILAPVDDSGTMRELCSEKCLSAVNSAQLQPRCKLCNKSCSSAFSVTVGGEVHRLCSNPCFTNFNKEDKSSWFICEICSSLCSSKRLVVKMKDDSKTVCGHECLVKLKEKAETSQPCPTCCTSHQLSDMVEKENDEGELDFFCSYRCMKVHKVQFCPPSDQKKSSQTPSSEEVDVKDVKPLMQSLLRIKEEPADEEFSQDRCDSVSSQEVKQEPDVPKEDLKISSVFSLLEDQKPAPSFLTQMDLNASCSTCQRVLMDGETVYQRKAHKDLFCSTSCLLKYYQMKSAKKTCHFCLQVIMEPQSVLQGSVDDTGTKKDFCSQICLSSFNYKRIMSNKLPVVAVASHSQCSVCSRYSVSKHEVILQDVVHKICSDPCFHRFCNINSLFMCENCGSRCNKPLRLKLEDGTKSLCGAECLTRFKQKIQTQQPCSMCRKAKLLSETVESRNGDVVELFCSKSCVTASKIQAVCASGAPLSCDNCSKTTVPVCHLAMWDASIRNFCSLTCAMVFRVVKSPVSTRYGESLSAKRLFFLLQETQKDRFRNAKDAETQDDGDKPPEGLPCAQCQQIMQTAPTVIQNKNQLIFVCSSSCSQEFKRINDITGVCEHCKSKRIIKEVKKVDSKNHNFCSDGCFTLFLHGLEKKCKKFCSSCCFCRSVSKTVVTSEGQKFCSEGCRSKNKLLLNHLVKCDTCHRRGKLTQSLPLLGHVRRFCDLRCLLHFCRQEGGTVSSGSPSPDGAVESSPVITNVMSLSNILKRHLNASSGSPPLVPDSGVAAGLLTDIQTRVVGHAGVQTTPTELKNKSTVCVPLVHNKGVCCCVQTVETGSQTVGIRPKVIQKVIPLPVPVPVPIYVPLALNMYSQYTPTPAVLPVPLPVPLCVPGKQIGSEPTVEEAPIGSEPTVEEAPIGSVEEDFNLSPEEGTEPEDECEADTREENEEVMEEENPQTSSSRETFSSKDEPEPDSIPDPLLLLFFQTKHYKIPNPTVLNDPGAAPPDCAAPAATPPSVSAAPPAVSPSPSPTAPPSDSATPVAPFDSAAPPPAAASPSAAASPPSDSAASVAPPFDSAATPPVSAAPPAASPSPTAPPPDSAALVAPFDSAAPPAAASPSDSAAPVAPPFDSAATPPAAASAAPPLESAATPASAPPPAAPLPASATLSSASPFAAPSPSAPPPASPSASPPPSHQTLRCHKRSNRTNREKLQRLSEGDAEEAFHTGSPAGFPEKRTGLNSQSGVDSWRRWVQWRESQISLGLPVSSPAVRLKTDVLQYSSSELNNGLCLFIKEVTRLRGHPHSPDSIFYLCLSIQQFLFENNRLENIFSDLTYQKFSSELTKILKHFRPPVSAPRAVHSRVEENFLWDCKQLGAYSPIVLLNTLLFFGCKYFGFATVEQHRQLSFANVVRYTNLKQNGTKITYLCFYPPTPADQNQSDADGAPAKKRRLNANSLRMKENTENLLRCPVRLYEFYLSKCSESIRRHGDLFYLQPDPCCVPSSPLWFSAMPLDDATIEAMIVRTRAVRLQQDE
ncbi:uncharacterized protein [Nothobranchius furzeri]|uniref:uncharacterized protein isoform X1 n=1 Tax=Nothobranchius furzeri TaxID=105023 RepID=UPI0024043A63|nr:uncharacterized protein LOC107374474 isoform X4 [Nothobranchius furzeri]